MKKTKITFLAFLILGVTLLNSCKKNRKKTEKVVEKTLVEHKEENKQEDIDKKLLAFSWLDTSDSKLHFTLNSDGTARSDNMATLLYKKWRVEGNNIIFTIESIGNHSSSTVEDIYKIITLNNKYLIIKQDPSNQNSLPLISKYRRKRFTSKKEKNKKIYRDLFVSSWIDTSDSKLHFTLNSDGTARSDNMATLLYKKWRIEGNNIVFTIKSIGNHTSSTDEYFCKIIKIDKNELIFKDGNLINKFIRKEHPTANIKRWQKITSPLTVKVNSQGVWFAWEGELGTVKIVDENGKVLNLKNEWGILSSADGNWMHSKPAFFKTSIPFDAKGAKKGKIIIYNNSGPGDGEEAGTSYSFEIPVTF